jgi:hypothetical protein
MLFFQSFFCPVLATPLLKMSFSSHFIQKEEEEEEEEEEEKNIVFF